MLLLAQVPDGTDDVVADVVEELARLTIRDWVVAVVIIVLSVVIARYSGKWTFHVLGGESSLGAITVSRLVRAGVLAVGFAVALMVVGVQLAPIVFFLAALTLLATLAFGPALADYVAGVVLTAKRPFDLGDLVTISGHRGVVLDHDLRAITLRSLAREDVTIPNRVAIAEIIVNVTRDGSWRSTVPVHIAYGSDLGQAREVVESAAAGIHGVMGDPQVRYSGLGESAVEMQVILFHAPDLDLKEQITDQVVERAHDALAAAGITIPFPQRDVWLRGEEPDA